MATKSSSSKPRSSVKIAEIQAAVRGLRKLRQEIGRRKGFKPLSTREIRAAVNRGRP